MQLIVDKLEKSFGVQEVFKDVSFMIAKEEKRSGWWELMAAENLRW